MKRTALAAGAFVALIGAGVFGAHLLVGSSRPPAVIAAEIDPAEAPDDAEAITRAYLQHWNVFADAMAHLDVSHLGEVFSGAALAAITDQVRTAAADHTPAVIRILRHRYHVVSITAAMASVDDTYLDQSVWVGDRPAPATWEHRTFTLSKEGTSWKVSDIIIYSSSR